MPQTATRRTTSKPIETPRQTDSPLPSGLEMLRGRPNRTKGASEASLLNVCANEATWERWRGVTRLQVSQALALHHRLDPDLLGLGQPGDAEQRGLIRQRLDVPGLPLFNFYCQLDFLHSRVRFHDDSDEWDLACLHVVREDRTSSITTPAEFVRFVSYWPLHIRPIATGALLPNREDRHDLPAKHSTPLLREVLAACALYTTVADGGTYVPGDAHTAPDVAAFLGSRGVSKKLAAAIATILRDPALPKGRRPKRRSVPE